MEWSFLIVQRCTWLGLKIEITKKIKSNVSTNENTIKTHQRFAGWSNVYGYNMSCLKNYVMREPLVDTVDKRQICTDHFPLQVNIAQRFVRLICSFVDIRFENNVHQWYSSEYTISIACIAWWLHSCIRHLFRSWIYCLWTTNSDQYW